MNPISVSVALGTLLPVVIAIIVQSHWSARVKAITEAIVCVAGGLALAYSQGQLVVPSGPQSAAVLFGDVAAVLATTEAVYHAIKPLGLTDLIERVTTLPRVQIQIGTPAAPTEVPAETPAETAPAA